MFYKWARNQFKPSIYYIPLLYTQVPHTPRWVESSYIFCFIYLSTFEKNIYSYILRVVSNPCTFYFYLSRFVKTKLYSYFTTLGYDQLVTFLFASLVFCVIILIPLVYASCECLILTECVIFKDSITLLDLLYVSPIRRSHAVSRHRYSRTQSQRRDGLALQCTVAAMQTWKKRRRKRRKNTLGFILKACLQLN